MKQFKLVDKPRGYINKADITNCSSGFLVSPSQNVQINDGEKISAVKGYSLFGAANAAATGIKSAYVWSHSTGSEIPLRSYQDELEYYYASAWRRLANGWSTSVEFNYAEWWSDTEKIDFLLFVNGSSNIYMWSGGITTFASATVNTITKQGTTTWAEERFLVNGTTQVIINGTTYTYTGGESTTTLTGVTPDPTLAGHAVGSVVVQAIRTTSNTPSANVDNDIIAMLNNQVYLADSNQRSLYVSDDSDYTNYTQPSPRTPGSPAVLTLDGAPIAFIPQENDMYISARPNHWYQTKFTTSADLTHETLTIKRLKTAPLSGAKSQSATGNIKNDVAIVTNELTLETLGRIVNVEGPQQLPISDPVKLDFDDFDYTLNPHVIYHKGVIHVTIPSSSRWMRYDMLRGYWQPPRVANFSFFSVYNGNLYGHSASIPESYLLDDGYNDNGNAIECIAAFAYRNFGNRAWLKNFDEHYTEGYIASNVVIDVAIKYDFGGFTTIKQKQIDGTDTSILFQTISDGSLGKYPFGNNPIGSITDSPSDLPKFRIIHEVKTADFYEYQVQYSTNDIDQQWELIAVGANARFATTDNVGIKQ